MNTVICRFGDLTIKGKNKRIFLRKIRHLFKEKLTASSAKIEWTHDRAYVHFDLSEKSIIDNQIKSISGITNYSYAVRVENNIEQIKLASDRLLKMRDKKNETFKVETNRAFKAFPYNSMEISKEVAKYVLPLNPHFSVDVHKPECTLHIDMREEMTYIYTDKQKGMGGFPVGVQGKGMLLLSGGIDSVVSGYLSMKQGIALELIHFESTPFTSIESVQKVIDLSKILARYAEGNEVRCHIVPFKNVQEAIMKLIPETYHTITLRRMMMKVTETLAKEMDCEVILSGESIGQVASQTLKSISVISDVIHMPVIRPLATTDKLDIINIAKTIGTFDISTRPFEDLCTVYNPINPTTSPSIKKANRFESFYDYDQLLEESIKNIKVFKIKSDSNLFLPKLGMTVQDIEIEKGE
jgi:thiamine biosynthesis protein ThiI